GGGVVAEAWEARGADGVGRTGATAREAAGGQRRPARRVEQPRLVAAAPLRRGRTRSVKTLLGRRAFRDLFVGQAVSALGDWMVTVALMALVLKLTRSSTAVGGVLVLRLVPAAIAGPLAARAAARWDRRRTMLTM